MTAAWRRPSACCSCLVRSRRSGQGEFIDVAKQDVLVSRADTVVGRMLAGELEPREDRGAFDHRGPAASFRCQNGFVYLFITSRAHWAGVRKLMEDVVWLGAFADDWLELGEADAIDGFRAGFAGWVADKDRAWVCEAGQRLGVPIVPVNDARDLQQSEQLAHRGFFQSLTHPVLGEALYPTVPYRLSATPARLERPAPRLGQDNGAVARHVGARAVRPGPDIPPRWSPGGRPCRGDHQGLGGPLRRQAAGHLGAEVIKVESNRNLDEMRVYGGVDSTMHPTS